MGDAGQDYLLLAVVEQLREHIDEALSEGLGGATEVLELQWVSNMLEGEELAHRVEVAVGAGHTIVRHYGL